MELSPLNDKLAIKLAAKLSVRDFALPVPRIGSIEAHSGFNTSSQEGIEIHQKIQEKRALADKTYQAEVSVTQEFERDGHRFQVSGRMDGFFNRDKPKIEEIKSTFNARELYHRLQGSFDQHPYCLQLKTYGYFHWLTHKVIPQLSFTLVSTRNYETLELDVPLDIPKYEEWLTLRLDELVQEAILCKRRVDRRIKISAKFAFPFANPRLGQTDLIQTIETGMTQNARMLVQAPTGLGKTAGVLYPTLKEAMSRGQNVIYVTPKNSQHSVAEDAVSRFQDTGSEIKSLTITAKSKICFKGEPVCNPDFCEYAKDHYTKVHENKVIEKLRKKKKLDAQVFRDLGEKYQVCPFELQMNAVPDADTVICDYNYVFSPRNALEKFTLPTGSQIGKPNLVIDEVHNLPSRAMDYYSPSLSSFVLEKMREEIVSIPKRFHDDAEQLLNECIHVLFSCRPDGEKPSSKIDPPTEPFLEQDSKLRVFLSRYLDSDTEIKPKDVILRLCFYWSQFTEALAYVTDPKRKEFFTTYHRHSSGGIVKITCCDASEMLKGAYEHYDQVVGFSATLKPFDFYSKLSGLESDRLQVHEFKSPFERSNRKVLIIPQISTKYSDRERNYSKIAEAIQKISSQRPGNYFVFFPSFDFLQKVYDRIIPPEGFNLLKQEREMRASAVDDLLTYLKHPGTKTLIFAVQGGVLSEGVDYPGDMIIGAFVVGPPLPNFNLEREEMRKYYDTHYQSGFDYAYTYPAMAKAVQAAGRVIRSETDRGIIVLMDNRFVQSSYTRSMPSDWFETSPRELVSESILKEVSEFWNG